MSSEMISEAFNDTTVRGNDRLVLWVLADSAYDDPRMVWLSIGFIAKRINADAEIVYQSLANLEAAGILEPVPSDEWPASAHKVPTAVYGIRPTEEWGSAPVSA